MSRTYRDFLAYKNVSSETQRTYFSVLNNYPVLPLVRKSLRDKIGLHHLINEYIIDLTSSGLNPNTVRKIYQVHRSYVRYLQWIGKEITVIWDAVILPPPKKAKSPKPLSNEDVKKLLGLKNETYSLMCYLGYEYALRISELQNLSINDFSGDFSVVTIEGSKKGTKMSYDVSDVLRIKLIQYVKAYNIQDKVFDVGQTMLQAWWHEACREAGLPANIRFHSLRHTAGAEETQGLLRMERMRSKSAKGAVAGMDKSDSDELRKRTRHKSAVTTVDHYGHLNED